MSRKLHTWKIRGRELQLGERTLVMGVLNVTPDSFSDGGLFDDPDRAYAHAMRMEQEGADIIDIGAESTRPGAEAISAAEELRRLVPVLKRLKDQISIPISVDTYKAEVAERALELGAQIINDPSGFTFDPDIAKPIVEYDAGFIINHMRGRPETWAALGPMQDVMGSIVKDLDASVSRARRAGVDRLRIVVDPGIGFGKRREQNFDIIARIGEMIRLELPLLLAPSRKSFLAHAGAEDTVFSTAGAVAACVLGGAHIVRVHDVAQMRSVVAVADEVARSIAARVEELKPVERPVRVSSRMREDDAAQARKLRPPIAQPKPVEKDEAGPEVIDDPILEEAAASAEPEVIAPPPPRERPLVPRQDRPYKPREERSGPPRGDRPFKPRPFKSGPGEERRYPPREERSGPPRGDRPFAPRAGKPFAPRGDKPFAPRGDRPFTPRGDKPFAPRGDKPFAPRSGPPRGDRPYPKREERSGPPRGDRPFAPRGDKPFAPRGDRPFQPREERSGPPRGDRPFKPREGGASSSGPGSRPPSGRPFKRDGFRPFKKSGPPRGGSGGGFKGGPKRPRKD